MMFSLSETVVLTPVPGGTPPLQLGTPQVEFARSTNRYSSLAVQFGQMAYSTPTPAVQPAWVVLLNGSAPAAAWTLAKAAPPVP